MGEYEIMCDAASAEHIFISWQDDVTHESIVFEMNSAVRDGLLEFYL